MDHLRSWLESIGPESSEVPIGETGFLQFVHDDVFGSANAFDSIRALHSREERERVHGFRAQFQPRSDMTVMVSNLGDPTGATVRRASHRIGGLPVRDELSIGPYAALAGRGVGMNVEWRLNEDTTMDAAGKDGDGYFGSANARLASLGLTRRTSDWLTFGARVGTIWEQGARAGSRGCRRARWKSRRTRAEVRHRPAVPYRSLSRSAAMRRCSRELRTFARPMTQPPQIQRTRSTQRWKDST